jgi:hypothetical protein
VVRERYDGRFEGRPSLMLEVPATAQQAITPPRRGPHLQARDAKNAATLVIPARRPIAAVYIRALVALADRFRHRKDGT